MSEPKLQLVDVRDVLAFMRAVVNHVRNGARLSLEGDLSFLDHEKLAGWSPDETRVLRRNTASPRLDFAVIPINEETRELLVESVFPRVGLRTRVVHVQIEAVGQLVLAAYDSFHPDCTLLQIENELLADLQKRSIVRSFEEAHA